MRRGNLPDPVARLFDDWVHDSRAWFKPFGDDDHIWERQQRQRMARLERQRQMRERLEQANKVSPGIQNAALVPPLTDAEKRDWKPGRKQASCQLNPPGVSHSRWVVVICGIAVFITDRMQILLRCPCVGSWLLPDPTYLKLRAR